MKINDFKIDVANASHVQFAETICDEMASSAKARGTGIAKRTPEYLRERILDGRSIIAFHKDGRWAGFCYIENWGHGKYVANSGLIVAPEFRSVGLATEIKKKAFQLSRKKYPEAKLFGLTTSLAVMKINSELGYSPVPYSELTQDEVFWKGCQSCVNYDILTMKERKNCMCTGMLYDPEDNHKQSKITKFIKRLENQPLFKRWFKIQEKVLLKGLSNKILKSIQLILKLKPVS